MITGGGPEIPGQTGPTCNIVETRAGSGSSNSRSGPPSQSQRSDLPPHSRQTTYSSSNLSYGPQSRPCVSMELANRLSPSDEPQSGQAIVRYPLRFNQLQPRQRSSECSLRSRHQHFLEQSSKRP